MYYSISIKIILIFKNFLVHLQIWVQRQVLEQMH